MDLFSAALAIKALDGLSVRAEITAANIANASTRGYRPQGVRFEDALRAAAQSGSAATVQAVQPRTKAQPTGLLSSSLRLDSELATASSTATRYAALIEVLNRRLEIERTAITGGRQ